jgi:hypothetical protein
MSSCRCHLPVGMERKTGPTAPIWMFFEACLLADCGSPRIRTSKNNLKTEMHMIILGKAGQNFAQLSCHFALKHLSLSNGQLFSV